MQEAALGKPKFCSLAKDEHSNKLPHFKRIGELFLRLVPFELTWIMLLLEFPRFKLPLNSQIAQKYFVALSSVRKVAAIVLQTEDFALDPGPFATLRRFLCR